MGLHILFFCFATVSLMTYVLPGRAPQLLLTEQLQLVDS